MRALKVSRRHLQQIWTLGYYQSIKCLTNMKHPHRYVYRGLLKECSEILLPPFFAVTPVQPPNLLCGAIFHLLMTYRHMLGHKQLKHPPLNVQSTVLSLLLLVMFNIISDHFIFDRVNISLALHVLYMQTCST